MLYFALLLLRQPLIYLIVVTVVVVPKLGCSVDAQALEKEANERAAEEWQQQRKRQADMDEFDEFMAGDDEPASSLPEAKRRKNACGLRKSSPERDAAMKRQLPKTAAQASASGGKPRKPVLQTDKDVYAASVPEHQVETKKGSSAGGKPKKGLLDKAGVRCRVPPRHQERLQREGSGELDRTNFPGRV